MASGLERYFDDAGELAAYEEFVRTQEMAPEPFDLERPALVCRWRMAGKRVPMLNRHIRSLSQRSVQGSPLSHNLLSWAKQHIEWSLAEGGFTERDGVLMLVVDVNGNAAMSVGAYEPLACTDAAALAVRAADARVEAAQTGVAPEVLCRVADGVLTLGAEGHLCGTATLVEQLAATRGLAAVRGEVMVDDATGLFLVSDEHGIVPAEGSAPDAFVELARAGYEKLRAAAR